MEIKIYTTRYCGFCHMAKKLLEDQGLPFEEISFDEQPELRPKISAENNNYSTVPMIFLDNKFIGGYTELATLHSQGKLTK